MKKGEFSKDAYQEPLRCSNNLRKNRIMIRKPRSKQQIQVKVYHMAHVKMHYKHLKEG